MKEMSKMDDQDVGDIIFNLTSDPKPPEYPTSNILSSFVLRKEIQLLHIISQLRRVNKPGKPKVIVFTYTLT